jgi:hypothetical protein
MTKMWEIYLSGEQQQHAHSDTYRLQKVQARDARGCLSFRFFWGRRVWFGGGAAVLYSSGILPANTTPEFPGY